MIKNFGEIIERGQQNSPKIIAVSGAHDRDVLMSVKKAKALKIAESILIGDVEVINSVAQENNIDIADFKKIHVKDLKEASEKAVELVKTKKADILMKGLVDNAIILKAALNKEKGIRKKKVLSHVGVFEIAGFDKLILATDTAMNIDPDVNTKKEIINNVLEVTTKLGINTPRVGIVCAKEIVSDKMPETLEAKELVDSYKAGEIKGCMVGGPFALDNAISIKAAEVKKIEDPVAGRADVLLVPDVEAGSILYKSMIYFAKAKTAGIILGAEVPLVLTSRADSWDTKLYSIALATLLSE
ncbi:bifunctional enoyl-CoA hydratase/phosphate acetyltransferase [Serpentinicella sp. ANB-PHB4]|uniref:bifunctional enoyl-CoA hydratase/phosphate acetyltransferase n=1 Tax=Serpentinicella sp. ANB-PHB4 TaxID=3074076 RepID=UPI00285EE833|nr:bifunctional enoyl-CoA hydratase/phosphate acetyltransferase [Serpentinicella sp. ANB-PHB4]MDR5659825.1 bifunctional enoyl-CoA hydratase/phosphate acetyltransferase [Serpentinicella sp. ANB-PHB4]